MIKSELFVGRIPEIQKLNGFLDRVQAIEDNSPSYFLISGPGGIGKTHFLTKAIEIAKLKGFLPSEVVDLKASANRSKLSFIKSLVDSIDRQLEKVYFSDFYQAIQSYNEARSEEKPDREPEVEYSFIKACARITEQKPLLLIIDTWESIEKTSLIKDWISNILSQLPGRIGILIAGRHRIKEYDSQSFHITLGKLSTHEAKELMIGLYKDRASEFDLSNADFRIIYRQTRGRPVRVALATDFIFETGRINKLLELSAQQFEEIVIREIRNNLQKRENRAIMLMSVASKRFDRQIVSFLGPDWSDYDELIKYLGRFSFTKIRIEANEPVITLHDEVLYLINKYWPYPSKTQEDFRAKLISEYYDLWIPKIGDPQMRQAYAVEKLYYLLHDNPDGGIEYFEHEMVNAIKSYRFDFCHSLLSELKTFKIRRELQRKVDLLLAEMYLRQYRTFAAYPIYKKLKSAFNPDTETEYFSRVLEGIGICKRDGADIEGTSFADVIGLLNKGIFLCEQKGLLNRKAKLLYLLGSTYEILGNHEHAFDNYNESLETLEDKKDADLKTKILDARGELHRQLNAMDQAKQDLETSLELKRTLGENLGASYLILGNAYRDVDDFPSAQQQYDHAEYAFRSIDDAYGLARVFNEVGWLKFLEGLRLEDKRSSSNNGESIELDRKISESYKQAIALTEESQSLAMKFTFGRLLSDNYHTLYHIKMKYKDREGAFSDLNKGIEFGRKYRNTYHVLDCLFHTAEAANERKDIAAIDKVIEEMDEIERQGCAFRIFKGRTLNVRGDLFYNMNDFVRAMSDWNNGYWIMMRYAKSGSSMAIPFKNQFMSRKEKIEKCLKEMPVSDVIKIKKHWEEVSSDYPFVLDVFNSYIGRSR